MKERRRNGVVALAAGFHPRFGCPATMMQRWVCLHVSLPDPCDVQGERSEHFGGQDVHR